MQKYADLNRSTRRHTRYAKLGFSTLNAGKLVVSKPRRRRVKPKANLHPHFRLWIMIFILLSLCLIYIRYQALYVENSVFRDLYKLVYEHFLSKDPLPPISKSITSNSSTGNSSTGNSSTGNSSTSNPVTVPQNVQQNVQQFAKSDQSFAVNTAPPMAVGIYQPFLDYDKDSIKFIVFSKAMAARDLGFQPSVNMNEEQVFKVFDDIMTSMVTYRSQSKNIKNLFHSKTKLRNAWVENDTLILDLNSYFERSKFGYKGIDIRVQQILWTFLNFKSEHFPTPIYYVSILIDGERKERIGGDGYALKPFYSRKDLRTKLYFP